MRLENKRSKGVIHLSLGSKDRTLLEMRNIGKLRYIVAVGFRDGQSKVSDDRKRLDGN